MNSPFSNRKRTLVEKLSRIFARQCRSSSAKSSFAKRLQYETLEPRIALAADGLVDVGSQPAGSLTGKIFYINGGHGYAAANTTTGAWSYGRDLGNGMIEDLGNQDQMTFFADSLFRAGATVVPMRPVGHQVNEVILDNDDVGVTFTGSWSNSASATYFGSVGDVPYRFASTSATETAVAKYTPNITTTGFYPIYTWALAGSDRDADQLYRINYAGGSTEVKVNHREVGTGLVYLGTYYFEAGTGGSVEISNRSSEAGKVVIADAIRFGNGMGDIDRGDGISGRPREDELSLYWIKWQVDHAQGVSFNPTTSSLDMDSNVGVVPRYARFMNREVEGPASNRVLISFHSNAGSGSTRGVLGLYNGNNRASAKTPNQLELASALGNEVNDDLVAQNGQFEFNWFDSNVVTLDRSDIEFGEINNESILNEFDATIVEVAYHDNATDAALMRDADVRAAVARATLQGSVKFFNDVDGGQTPLVMAPGEVSGVAARTTGGGSVTVSWVPPVANSYNGDAATGYMVYGSTNGYGFDGGTFVAGGASTSFTYTGLDTAEGAYYFKVVAVNAGGASPDSEVVAAMANAGARNILIVNGFDRLSRQQNPVQAGAERVRPRQSNSYDYAVQVASAIEIASPNLVVDTASNEAVISGAINLADYQAVVWILGEESTLDDTFNSVEQTLVTNYLAQGGQLFASGSEIAFELGNGNAFLNNQLHANFVSDDANTYNAGGVSGSIFEGLNFSFDNGAQFYNVDFPDVITPAGGSTAAINYSTGTTAGIQYDGGPEGSRVVLFAFPFETITNTSLRNQVFARVLNFFEFDLEFSDVDIVLDNDNGPAVYTEAGTWTLSGGTGYNGLTYKFTPSGSAATATWQFYAPFAGEGEVFVQYVAAGNRASSTTYEIETGNGTENVSIDQKQNSLTWVSLGTFDFTLGNHDIVLNAQTSSGGSVVVADAVRVVLPVPVTVVENADFDDDGDVDGRDFLTWQRGFGIIDTATLSQGDANDDGNIDAEDLAIWQAQYGQPAVMAQTASVIVIESAPVLAAVESSIETTDQVLTASLPNVGLLFAPRSIERREALRLIFDDHDLGIDNPQRELESLDIALGESSASTNSRVATLRSRTVSANREAAVDGAFECLARAF